MYSEHNHKNSARRANDDFLRRMLGGELTGDGYPVMSLQSTDQSPVKEGGTNCQGLPRQEGEKACEKGCPTHVNAPSIAMVYAPRQCWRKLLDPSTGLSKGSIFEELVLPLEAVHANSEKEVKIRRPL